MICELVDLAPFAYRVTVQKDGYEDLTTDIKIQKKNTLSLDIKMKKSVYVLPTTNVENISGTGAERIEYLKTLSQLKQKEKYFETIEKGNFYLEKNSDTSYSLF
jgi:hypothetical protein